MLGLNYHEDRAGFGLMVPKRFVIWPISLRHATSLYGFGVRRGSTAKTARSGWRARMGEVTVAFVCDGCGAGVDAGREWGPKPE